MSSKVSSSLKPENVIIKNSASFCFNVTAVLPFNLIIVGVVNKALDEVYRKAVQYLF